MPIRMLGIWDEPDIKKFNKIFTILFWFAKISIYSSRFPCDTMRVGKNLDTSYYGIATSKSSGLQASINQALLNLQNNRVSIPIINIGPGFKNSLILFLTIKIDFTNFRYLRNFKKDGGPLGVLQPRTTSAIPGKFTGFFLLICFAEFPAKIYRV